MDTLSVYVADRHRYVVALVEYQACEGGGARAARRSIGTQLMARVASGGSERYDGGISRGKAFWHASATMLDLGPASCPALTAVSTTARGRGVGGWSRATFGTCIPKKMRKNVTVTATAWRILFESVETFIGAMYTNCMPCAISSMNKDAATEVSPFAS